MPNLPNPIFISYSHKDVKLVRPIVPLLRATKDLVFPDADNIRPDRKWKPKIEKALVEAKLIVLFWCKYSLKSDEVKNEYEYPFESKKGVLPVLLDEFELPDELGEFEWVDFQKLSRFSHKSGWAWIRTTVISLLVFLGLSRIVITLFKGRTLRPFSYGSHPRASSYSGAEILVLFLIMALAIFAICLLVRSQQRKINHQKMAQGMYAEIIKRKNESLIKE